MKAKEAGLNYQTIIFQSFAYQNFLTKIGCLSLALFTIPDYKRYLLIFILAISEN